MLSGPAVADAVADPNSAISKLVRTETDDKKVDREIFLRVLNRAPTQAEIDLTLENWSGIEQDFQTLVAQLATKEGEWVPKKTELERQRLLAINKAKGELDAYMPVHLKEKAAAEAKQAGHCRRRSRPQGLRSPNSSQKHGMGIQADVESTLDSLEPPYGQVGRHRQSGNVRNCCRMAVCLPRARSRMSTMRSLVMLPWAW
ncbi:MAG: hypothetical protein R3F31_13935 [Verrucomicrobiales bacterium]